MEKIKSIALTFFVAALILGSCKKADNAPAKPKTDTTTEENSTTADATVNINTSVNSGISRLSLGVTHTHGMWESGNATAVTNAKNLLIPAVKYQNQHIMGFGADNPQPTQGGAYSFNSLDSRVNLMRSIGGKMVITFCTAPGWMKTTGNDWDMDARVADNKVADFANLAKAIAQRYTDVKYFQIWNEMKGYWNSSMVNSDGSTGNFDYVKYTILYNAVYTAVKSVRPDAIIGGWYASLLGDASGTLGYSGNGTFTPIGVRDMDSLIYWLANKTGADFICMDRWLKDWANSNTLTNANGMALTWTYKKVMDDIKTKTSLPIWFSEYYTLPNAANGSQYVAAAMASIYYNMIKGAGSSEVIALAWNPQEGENYCPHYLFNSTATSTGGQSTPHYTVFKGMTDHFPNGTQLYQATSSDANIEVLAGASKTMLINKYNASKVVSVNGVDHTLAAYAVSFINTPSGGATFTKVDDAHASIVYTGTWGATTNSTGYYNLTQHYVNETSTLYDAAQLSFTGSAVNWVFAKGPDRGKTDVYIDGTYIITLDLYSSTYLSTAALYSKVWGSSGSHTIKIVALNQKNASSSNYYSGLDYFEYLP